MNRHAAGPSGAPGRLTNVRLRCHVDALAPPDHQPALELDDVWFGYNDTQPEPAASRARLVPTHRKKPICACRSSEPGAPDLTCRAGSSQPGSAPWLVERPTATQLPGRKSRAVKSLNTARRLVRRGHLRIDEYLFDGALGVRDEARIGYSVVGNDERGLM